MTGTWERAGQWWRSSLGLLRVATTIEFVVAQSSPLSGGGGGGRAGGGDGPVRFVKCGRVCEVWAQPGVGGHAHVDRVQLTYNGQKWGRRRLA
jgi:hypothetical protein